MFILLPDVQETNLVRLSILLPEPYPQLRRFVETMPQLQELLERVERLLPGIAEEAFQLLSEHPTQTPSIDFLLQEGGYEEADRGWFVQELQQALETPGNCLEEEFPGIALELRRAL